MMRRLFVIGNGFDLHHELKTGLNDFRKYMEDNFPIEYRSIMCFFEKYFTSKVAIDWKDLETHLSCTKDVEEMLEEAVASSETDMDRASYWDSIQYNAGVTEDEFGVLLDGLDGWISSISVAEALPKEKICFTSRDLFLNFNYTDSLQKLYGVEEKQILHIHGSISTSKILGHNDSYEEYLLVKENLTQADYDHGLEADWRMEEAKDILNRIPRVFFKDSLSIIRKNKAFFETIKEYDEIIFMGWALGLQDEVYMDEIMAQISTEKKILKVVGYKQESFQIYEDYFEKYEDLIHDISYFLWKEIEQVFSSERECHDK